jgi:uncharacterized membrane protein YphA (DoxX/SURF4 family)
MKKGAVLLLILRIFLGAVFMMSGFQKLTVPAENFQTVIEKFEIVRGPAAAALSHVIPWCEFVFGALLALGLWTDLALAVLWSLNLFLIGVVLSAILRKLPIDECGCFGKALSLSLPQIFTVDLALSAFFAVFFFLRRSAGLPGLDRFFEKSS